MSSAAWLVVLFATFLGGYLGYVTGYGRSQNKYIPEINEANETIARLRLLSKLQVCRQCDGEQNVYNKLGHYYQPCSVCNGAGEVKSEGRQ